MAPVLTAFERDGVQALERILDEGPPAPAWLDVLIAGVARAGQGVPAAWLLRAYLEREVELERRQTAALIRSLSSVEEPEARLLLCQSVAHLEVPARNAEALARFLRRGATGEHKFTRAWAVDGMVRLAQQHPRFRREALALLERAGRDPAASVRARARRIAGTLHP